MQVVQPTGVADTDALDTSVIVQQLESGGVVIDGDAGLTQRGVQRGDQLRAAAVQVARQPAPKFEFAVHLERLPAQRRLEFDAMLLEPQRRLVGPADQHLGQLRVAAVLRQPAHVVEILAFRVGAEIDVRQVEIGDVRRQGEKFVDPVVNEAECAPGEGGVAAARGLRRGFQHGDGDSGLVRGQRGVGGGITGADHEDIDRLVLGWGHLRFPAADNRGATLWAAPASVNPPAGRRTYLFMFQMSVSSFQAPFTRFQYTTYLPSRCTSLLSGPGASPARRPTSKATEP